MSDKKTSISGRLKAKSISMRVSTKKFLSSKAANNSAAQALVISSLGVNGEEIFDHIGIALTSFYGEEQTERILTDTLRMALKTKVLIDEKLLTDKDSQVIEGPLRKMSFQMVKDFSAEEEKRDDDVTLLTHTISVFQEAVVPRFQPHIQTKNLETLSGLFDKFKNTEFLDYVLTSSDMLETRAVLRLGLQPLVDVMQMFDMSNKSPEKCKVLECTLMEVKSKGFFIGRGYCKDHYTERMQPLIDSPCLLQYLEYPFLSVHFVDYIIHKGFYVSESGDVLEGCAENQIASSAVAMNYLNFYQAMNRYLDIGASGILVSRAEMILRNYTEQGSTKRVWLPVSIVEGVHETLKKKKLLAKHVFAEATDYTVEILEKMFVQFVRSSFFERATSSITVPTDI